MAFQTPDFESIKAKYLRDVQNTDSLADTASDSDHMIRANATASAIEGLYEHQQYIKKQIFPDEADSENLARHARTRGLSKKSGVASSGLIGLVGTPGAIQASGSIAQTVDGRQYQTTVDCQIGGDGTASVAAQASSKGSSTIATAGTALTLLAPGVGVNSAASIVSMVGGTNDETDEELLARLLEVIRRPPAGGNVWDFRRWAMSVDGVSAAYVYPLRRGLGTVDIVVTSSGGLPSEGTVLAVQTYIDSVRPVTAKNSMVIKPTLRVIDHSVLIAVAGTTFDAAKSLVLSAVPTYFDALAPGDAYVKSRVEAIVSDLAGIADRAIPAPVSNVTPRVDADVVEWCRLGALTVGQLT